MQAHKLSGKLKKRWKNPVRKNYQKRAVTTQVKNN